MEVMFSLKRMLCDLKMAREVKEFSQEKLAQMVGVTRETIRNIEAGETIPGVFLALAIANTVGKDISELFKKLQ
jgi:putative transcriptional regulator